MVHYSKDGFLLCNGCADDHRHSEGNDQVIEEPIPVDEQCLCAACGLYVDIVTGKHIDEFIG